MSEINTLLILKYGSMRAAFKTAVHQVDELDDLSRKFTYDELNAIVNWGLDNDGGNKND